jgi:predicted DNA binding CopG/RHH family protein
MKKPLKLPRFKTEDAERDFWSRIDLADYFERKDFQAVSFPNLKPSSRPISLRLPEPMILRLKERANERRVPYQSLIKQYLAEALKT